MTPSNSQEQPVKPTYFAPVFVTGSMGAGTSENHQTGFSAGLLSLSPVEEN